MLEHSNNVCEKILNTIDVFALLRGDYARIQYRRTFFMDEGYRENDAGGTGIQDVDTHAPCWNQVKMCVQIRPIPSACCVFGAGIQYRFKENGCCKRAEIQRKSSTDHSKKKC